MKASSENQTKAVLVFIGFLLLFVVAIYVIWQFNKEPISNMEYDLPEDSQLKVSSSTSSVEPENEVITTITPKELFTYILIKNSCGIHFETECVRVRSGPGVEYPVVARLRNNVLLRVSTTTMDGGGYTWYKIIFDETLLYPERVSGEWYVASEYTDVLLDEGIITTETGRSASTTQQIIVDISEQKLYAYDDDVLFMEVPASTGLLLSPTPRGTFTVFRKMPSRYMQGPLPGYTDYYDLPGVPWNLYFTEQGAVIHGAYWHDSFGKRYSHGCVNLLPSDAKKLYGWAALGIKVTVRD